jgi:hypothetical protein
MATFVLVPGGWHGGWYFQPLAEALSILWPSSLRYPGSFSGRATYWRGIPYQRNIRQALERAFAQRKTP